ncbi:MAG TPA: FAD:protein FMN transferase [Acidimicrobiales bacterium]|nr:FAD:protein FMN transferase [Acidimicrobiales bacterium]
MSATGEPAPMRHAEPVMGTVVSFAVHPGTAAPDTVRRAIADACGWLHHADRVFSTWDADSPMSRLRRGELGLADVPGEIPDVLRLCEIARERSGGWFDPWRMPGGVDPTGLVKGWAVQRAATILRRSGAQAVMVNGGGDVATVGKPGDGRPWRVGIQHPWRADALACVVEPARCVATSGAYQRGLHLTDPHTGTAACRVASATVTGPSLALADALATGLAVAGEEGLGNVAGLPGYGAYVICPDGREVSTPGFRFAAQPVPAR